MRGCHVVRGLEAIKGLPPHFPSFYSFLLRFLCFFFETSSLVLPPAGVQVLSSLHFFFFVVSIPVLCFPSASFILRLHCISAMLCFVFFGFVEMCTLKFVFWYLRAFDVSFQVCFAVCASDLWRFDVCILVWGLELRKSGFWF